MLSRKGATLVRGLLWGAQICRRPKRSFNSKESSEAFPREFSEQFGTSTHKMKGFSGNSPQKVHRTSPKTLEGKFLGIPFLPSILGTGPPGLHPRIRLALPSSGVDLASIQHRFDIDSTSISWFDPSSMSNRCQIDPWWGEGEVDSRVGSGGPVPDKPLPMLLDTGRISKWAQTGTDRTNPIFWGLQNWFWRGHFTVRFPPKIARYVLPPPTFANSQQVWRTRCNSHQKPPLHSPAFRWRSPAFTTGSCEGALGMWAACRMCPN